MLLGNVASTGSFRAELNIPRPAMTKMLAASVAGSLVGALLLLRTSNASFSQLIPILLFVATALFVLGPRLTRMTQHVTAALTVESPVGIALQFAIAIYGGFFGAAMGILMLALLGVLGMHDLRRANAFKVFLSMIVNGVAVVPFVLARAIAWDAAIVMSVGAIAGGYIGAGLVKRLPSSVVRTVVIVVACAMTGYFAWKTYLARG
ncbi:MAG: sulfite exporter TauE/SafE family protein [Vulcanimicrobiaceae bacterium]